MNDIYFGNKGHFDPRAMLTFGISAKEKEDAIGYFGTGFKYAIAIILRLGGRIEVSSAGSQYIFTKEREQIRGQEFEIVKVNGQDAGFTTRLGINWEPWMAFRELWCNCMDESGLVSASALDCETVVHVSCSELVKAYHEREMFFITGKPIVETAYADIYDKPSSRIFYRGIAVANTGKSALLTYNIKTVVDLTEDRTAKYEYQTRWPIQRALQGLEDRRMLRKVIGASRNTFEGNQGFDKDFNVSESFMSVAREMIATGNSVNESARRIVSMHDEKAGNWPEFELSKVQSVMLRRAVEFLSRVGVDIGRYPVKIVSGLGDSVMGRALDSTIYLSELPFNMGTKQVASTLLEEWVHNSQGCADFDRRMQNWLLDKILSLAEEMRGEPL